MNEDNEIDDLDRLFGKNDNIEQSLSYSRLSDFDRNGPAVLIKKSNINGYGMTIGSITDDLLLPAEGFKFEDNYIVCDFEKPTATLGSLIDIILENYTKVPSKEKILEICNTNNYWKRSKDDTIIANFNVDNFWDYINIHIQGNDKNIISSVDKSKAENLIDSVKETKFEDIKYIFNNEHNNYNQFKIDFEYNGVKFKGIIDRLIIDHKNKTVQLIDLKTGKDSALMFTNSFIKHRYYLQEAVYTKAFNHICEVLNLKGYSLLPFQFLYIGRSERIPLIYTVSKKWHKAAVEGFNIKEYVYKGLDELIEDVKWHFNNKEFEVPRKIYEQQGNIILNDNFIDIK
jgi:hypothetical protein